MANKLTLDEALADLYEHTGDKYLDPEWVDVVRQNNKQAILQWVADEVVGKNGDAEEYDRGRGYPQIDLTQVYFNRLRDEQRQILKAHGWKES